MQYHKNAAHKDCASTKTLYHPNSKHWNGCAACGFDDRKSARADDKPAQELRAAMGQ